MGAKKEIKILLESDIMEETKTQYAKPAFILRKRIKNCAWLSTQENQYIY